MKPFRWFACGATGTGKTAWTVQQIKRLAPDRLMIWDPKHDVALADLGTPYASWPDFVRACRAPRFQARYRVSHDHDPHEQFAAFCGLAWREGNVLMFVDELAEVTQASRAPGAWRKINNVGRSYEDGKKSISVIGVSQSPMEVDKSFLGNCDLIHTGRLGNIRAAKLFAAQWGIDAAELSNLPPLHWVEKRDVDKGVTRGVLRFDTKTTPTPEKKEGRAGNPKAQT